MNESIVKDVRFPPYRSLRGVKNPPVIIIDHVAPTTREMINRGYLAEFKTPVSVIDGGWSHRPDRLESVEDMHLYTLNHRKRRSFACYVGLFAVGLLSTILVYLS